jgi:hypothetical protein
LCPHNEKRGIEIPEAGEMRSEMVEGEEACALPPLKTEVVSTLLATESVSTSDWFPILEKFKLGTNKSKKIKRGMPKIWKGISEYKKHLKENKN